MVRSRWSRLLAATASATTRLAGLASVALLTMASPAGAAGPLNVVRGVVAAESGGATVVTIIGSETATFTSYKLERPQRLAIEVARCRLQGADSPVDVSKVIFEITEEGGTAQPRLIEKTVWLSPEEAGK